MTATFPPQPWPLPPGRTPVVPRQFGASSAARRRVQACRSWRIDVSAEDLTEEPTAGQGSRVELSRRGGTIGVGRLLRPELRAAGARELRQAVRQLPATIPPATEPN